MSERIPTEDTIFDMKATYRKSCAQNYCRTYFTRKISSESEYKTTSTACKKLCPMTFERMPKGAEERFKYFQFLKYMMMMKRDYDREGCSVFKCIEVPSERYLSKYIDMMKEIRDKVSESIRTLIDGPDFTKAESIRTSEGRYDDSIHALQQNVDLIALTLDRAYNYGDDALKVFEARMRLFHTEMKRLAKGDYPNVSAESYWDELYLRLNYARCIYWESDLLSAYKAVEETTHKSLTNEHECFAMLQDENRKYVMEDDCFLLFDKASGEIIEAKNLKIEKDAPQNSDVLLFYSTTRDVQKYDAETPFDVDAFIEALGRYVENNVQEIARKTFHVQEVTSSEENRILRRTKRVCSYLKMELQRYGRNSIVTKSKLISAFQVVFLTLTDIAPVKKSTVTTETDKGLRRERITLSSSYFESKSVSEGNEKKKDSLYFQWICTWTNYQLLWNACGPDFAKKYLEVNITALETITAVDYQTGMATLQLHTEKVLLATITLQT